MPTDSSDPLLRAGKLLAGFFMLVIALCVVAMPLLALALLFNQSWLAEHLGPQADSILVVDAAIAALLGAGVLVGIAGFQFMRQLRRIIDTVAQGEPFAPDNADRLAQMGWLILGIQAAALLLGGLAEYVQAQFPAEHIDIDLEFSLEGLLLAVVLFILARVFRHGNALREDLEGTV